jgi:hypothetical protein
METLEARLKKACTEEYAMYFHLALRWVSCGLDACEIDGKLEELQSMCEPDSQEMKGLQAVTDVVIAYIADTLESGKKYHTFAFRTLILAGDFIRAFDLLPYQAGPVDSYGAEHVICFEGELNEHDRRVIIEWLSKYDLLCCFLNEDQPRAISVELIKERNAETYAARVAKGII